MRAFLAAVGLLLSAQASYVAPCGTKVNCVRVGGTDGGTVQLSGAVQTVRYATPDGGGVQMRVQPSVSSVPIAVLGGQSRTSTQPDVIIGGTVARDGGQGPIVSFRTGAYEIATVTTNGFAINGGLTLSSRNYGARLMDGGAQTLTVNSGANCMCNSQTDEANGCKLPVSGTTATFTATTGETMTYLCLP